MQVCISHRSVLLCSLRHETCQSFLHMVLTAVNKDMNNKIQIVNVLSRGAYAMYPFQYPFKQCLEAPWGEKTHPKTGKSCNRNLYESLNLHASTLKWEYNLVHQNVLEGNRRIKIDPVMQTSFSYSGHRLYVRLFV